MTQIQLIYCSRPFGFDEATLNGLLIQARENNIRNDITGALVCRADLYLQLLEGPKQKIEKTFEKITEDDRHVEVRKLLSQASPTRLFPGWAMLDDPARTWFWTKQEIENGVLEKVTTAEVIDVFVRVAKEIATC